MSKVVLSILVNNTSGVLSRVTGLFSRVQGARKRLYIIFL